MYTINRVVLVSAILYSNSRIVYYIRNSILFFSSIFVDDMFVLCTSTTLVIILLESTVPVLLFYGYLFLMVNKWSRVSLRYPSTGTGRSTAPYCRHSLEEGQSGKIVTKVCGVSVSDNRGKGSGTKLSRCSSIETDLISQSPKC